MVQVTQSKKQSLFEGSLVNFVILALIIVFGMSIGAGAQVTNLSSIPGFASIANFVGALIELSWLFLLWVIIYKIYKTI